ncbi:TetR family transcriptional regulator [Frondihabitans sucicola]|uniref:TetR family transcriptional regulator n=1 Tax=Frondihabitans sucicola TaxID=1268041 RepID=A0ABM8GSC0_9MICO|nr:TetR-like C-terminal domain-containing protein [Frondihabitans sucicola]BDZ51375.1 TetR family transcriptional regulator [Frondihabitans sucicola]
MPRVPLSSAGIIAAAADLADHDGFDTVVLSDVARALGVQTASLYNHVHDRAAVLDGIHELALGELAEAIAASVAGRSRADALIGLGEAQRDYARRFPGRWAALQRVASPTTVKSEPARRLATLTLAVLRGYELPEARLVHAVRMLGAMVNGFVALERTGGFDHRDPESEVSWGFALDALDTVFTAWGSLEKKAGRP